MTVTEFVDLIRQIGINPWVLSTDGGAIRNESPPDVYETLVARLRDAGLSDTELERLPVDNP